MSTGRRSAADDFDPPDSDTKSESGEPHLAFGEAEKGATRFHNASGGQPGSGRKRRRRQRSQRGKRGRPQQSGPLHADLVSRERVFQDIEGLLRQIREQAEESATWTEEQLNEITQAVTGFTRSLEQEVDPISERARSEYQRIRGKLSQALRG